MNPFRIKRCILILGILLCLVGCASEEEKHDKFLTEGRVFYEQGEYKEAIIQAKNALELKPDSAKAYGLLSETYFKQGDAQNGFAALLQQEKRAPDDHDVAAKVASFFLLGGKMDEARSRMDAILKVNPQHIPTLFLEAGIYSQSQGEMSPEKLDTLTEMYNKILALDAKQVRAHLALARIQSIKKDYPGAEAHLQKAIDIEDDNVGLYQTLHGFYMARRDMEAAQDTLQRLIDRLPDKALPQILMGNFYLRQADLDGAEPYFLAAIQKEPQNLDPHMTLARIYNQKKEFKKSEAYIKKAIEVAPDNYAVKVSLAEFYFSHQNIPLADQQITQILTQRPNFLTAKVLKGRILAHKQKYTEAIDIFRGLIADEPKAANYQFLLGKALAEKGEISQARNVLTKAIQLNPDMVPARLLLSNLYFEAGDFFMAETLVNRILDSNPQDYNANILLGNIRMADKKYPEAEKIFKTLVEESPKNPVAYYRLGLLERSRKNYNEALTLLHQSLELAPNLVDVFSSIIATHMSQKHVQKALDECDRHLKRMEKDTVVASVIYYLKGQIFRDLNQNEAAETAYRESIRINPRHTNPYRGLARLLLQAGRMDEAITLNLELSKQRPDLAFAHADVAMMYEKNNQLDLAETHYQKALKIDPNHMAAANNLAFLYAEQNRNLNKALELARRAKEKLGNVPAIMDTLGWVFYKKSLYDSAAQEFESCVKRVPKNPIFHYHLGLTYHKLSQYKKAKKYLKEALRLQPDFKGAQEARSLMERL